jgi:hypothetical protein
MSQSYLTPQMAEDLKRRLEQAAQEMALSLQEGPPPPVAANVEGPAPLLCGNCWMANCEPLPRLRVTR